VYLSLKDAIAAEDQPKQRCCSNQASVEAQFGLAEAQIAKGNFTEALNARSTIEKCIGRMRMSSILLAKAYSGLGKKTEAQKAVRAEQLFRKK
jgi:hypothetical protein